MKDNMKPCDHSLPDDVIYKEVVVIGNGPSGMVTSFMLAGNVPYLKEVPKDAPIDEMLKARLLNLPTGQNLYEVDLEQLAEGLEGRSHNPIPLLLDNLMRPGADVGMQTDSLVDWRFEPDKRIDHVVLGRGGAGGAWRTFPAGVVTLSPGAWLTLPPHVTPPSPPAAHSSPAARIPAKAVAAYCRRYVKLCDLQQYFRNGVVVNSVQRAAVGSVPVSEQKTCFAAQCALRARWTVTGYEVSSGRRFRYVCARVVVACGAGDRASTLPPLARHAHHSLASLEQALSLMHDYGSERPGKGAVLVVGSGLSAADAVLAARRRGVPAFHVHRTPPDALARLPSAAYPDYAEVYKMMCDGPQGVHENYLSLYQHTVLDVSPDDSADVPAALHDLGIAPKRVTLLDLISDTTKVVTVSVIVVLIGSKPDLHFLQTSDFTYVTEDDRPCMKCMENKYKRKIEEPASQCYLKTRWHYLKSVLGQSIQSCKSRYMNTEINGNDSDACALADCRKQTDSGFVGEFENGTIQARLVKDCGYKGNCDCEDSDGIGLGIDASKPVDSRANPIAIDTGSHEVLKAPSGMYALGPLTADNFVRFIPGGALAAVAHMHKTRNEY